MLRQQISCSNGYKLSTLEAAHQAAFIGIRVCLAAMLQARMGSIAMRLQPIGLIPEWPQEEMKSARLNPIDSLTYCSHDSCNRSEQ